MMQILFCYLQVQSLITEGTVVYGYVWKAQSIMNLSRISNSMGVNCGNLVRIYFVLSN